MEGTFDEEECRYFLREVGAQVITHYPFSLGMEEAYSLIFERYGLEGCADAVSVLHELLEGEDSVVGCGDDGDIWRTWRHRFRHRNDDSLDPWIPRAGKLILPQPTTSETRKIKARNFVDQLTNGIHDHTKVCTAGGLSNEPLYFLPPIQFYTKDEGNQEAAMRDCSSETSTSSGSGITFARPTFAHQRCRTFLSGLIPSADSSKAVGGVHSDAVGERIEEIMNDPFPVIRRSLPPMRTPLRLAEDHSDELDPRATSSEGGRRSLNCLSPAETPSPQRRNARRNARLIDGAIFPFSGRKTSKPSVDIQQGNVDAILHTRMSPARTVQKPDSRSGWLQGIKSLFRPNINKQTKFRPPSKHRHSSTISQRFSEPLCLPSSHRGTASSLSDNTPSMRIPVFLDGSCDDRSSTSTYLNKPLPLSPGAHFEGVSSRTRNSSGSQLRRSPPYPRTASSASTSVSQCSSRKEFHDIMRKLLADDSERHTTSKTMEDSEPRLYASVYDPKKIPTLPPSPMTFTSVAQRNPFIDDPAPLTPTPITPQTARRRSVESVYVDHGLPPSHSEPSFLVPREGQNRPHHRHNRSLDHCVTSKQSPEKSTIAKDSGRGRQKGRAETSQTDSPNAFNTTNSQRQVKRSQSPVKRLFGLGKSTPSRDDQVDTIQNRAPTPGSSTKRSLKQWGQKLRQGLTADQEEREREAYMESHMDSRSALPASTFPISLDPSYQARLMADVELMIIISTNRFLIREARESRLSEESVARIRRTWEAKNHAQVVEYQFDQDTQRQLVLANLTSLQFPPSVTNDPVSFNSILIGWAALAKEMAVRTFCAGDSVIRKWLHDAHRVLQLVSAAPITFIAFDKMQVKALRAMSDRQEAKALGHTRSASDGTYEAMINEHLRDFSGGSQVPTPNISHRGFGSEDGYDTGPWGGMDNKLKAMYVTPVPSPERKPTGAWGAVTATPSPNSFYGKESFDNSRGGTPGKTFQYGHERKVYSPVRRHERREL